MSEFNSSFKYLRKESDLSMSRLATELSKLLDGKNVTVPQIQSYEGSTSAKYEVLLAIRDFYRGYDSKFSLDHLLERDLEKENYRLPEDKVKEKKEEIKKQKTDSANTLINEELVRARKIIMDQAETILYLTKKIESLENI